MDYWSGFCCRRRVSGERLRRHVVNNETGFAQIQVRFLGSERKDNTLLTVCGTEDGCCF